MKRTLLVLTALVLVLVFSRSAGAVLDVDLPGELLKETDTKVTSTNGSPFAFPFAGKTLNQRVEWQPLATGGTLTMLNKSTGASGVVRNIQIILQMPNVRVNAEHIRLNIAYDGSANPSVSVPVTSLIGYETGESLIAGSFTTPFFSVTTPAMNNNQDLGFILRYPVPYTNGIQMYLDTDGTPGLSATVWTNTFYQDTLPSSAWNRNLRFLVARSDENVPAEMPKAGTISVNLADGSVVGSAATNFQQNWVGKYLDANTDLQILAVQDSHNLTVSTSDVLGPFENAAFSIAEPHTFLDRSGEAGWIAAVYAGFTPSSPDFSYLEGNVRFFVDGEMSPSLQWSGTEDFFGNAFYFESKSQDDTGGVVGYNDVTAQVTAYRQFSDHPVRYTRSIRGVWPNFFDAVQTNWTAVYYREM